MIRKGMREEAGVGQEFFSKSLSVTRVVTP